MRIEINRNETRYNSEDLQAIADKVADIVGGRDWSNRTISINVKYGGERPNGRRRRWRSSDEESTFVSHGRNTLRIASLAVLTEGLDPSVALASLSQGVLPPEVVLGIADAIRALTFRWVSDFPYGEEVWGSYSVRVENKVQTPIDRRKRTKEEKIATMLDHYGPGGELLGSSRTSAWHWRSKVQEAERHYMRELHRREAWAEKIQAAGGKADPYETWAEYLRRVADEWDAIQKAYRQSRHS